MDYSAMQTHHTQSILANLSYRKCESLDYIDKPEFVRSITPVSNGSKELGQHGLHSQNVHQQQIKSSSLNDIPISKAPVVIEYIETKQI